jgi:hypothetical protein
MSVQTEAQKLADGLDFAASTNDLGRKPDPSNYLRKASKELLRLDAENKALRACALKYLDYLNVTNQNKALESDLKNPEMIK